jgi:protein gp37
MSDLFHEAVPFEYIDTVYSTMMSADWHTYQILTKRPERALEYYESVERDQGECCEPNPIRCMPNVQLLVSVSTQKEMDKAENVLWQIPAVVRGFSFEPLLGPIRDVPPFEWHIVGCESGPKRRPCKLEWVRDIVRQCKEAGVACFVKQIPRGRINPKSMKYWQKVSTNPDEWPQDLRVREYPR